jgi:hypothetical protein
MTELFVVENRLLLHLYLQRMHNNELENCSSLTPMPDRLVIILPTSDL